MSSLFKMERKFLEKAKKKIDDNEYHDEKLFVEYKKIVKEYDKFLNQMEKLFSINDNQQKLVKDIKDKLEKEITERKKVEKMLENKIEELMETKEELEKANQTLDKMSFRDELTKIPNRRSFNETLNKEWEYALRNRTPISMAVIDIDYFKEYNDNYGHLEGDECIKKVANELADNIKRPFDFVGRFGGDEFVVILHNTDKEGACTVASRIVKNIIGLGIPHEYSKISEKFVTISVGVVSLVPDENISSEDIIKFADKALYEAKEKGRNQYAFYDIYEKEEI